MEQEQEDELLRRYAAMEITWDSLRRKGFHNYVDVLSGLGRLGLRPPIAPMSGPNVAIRTRGIAMLERALAKRRTA